MVEKALEILASLVPLWVAFLAIAFGYLIYLFKRVSNELISLSEKQAEYLRDRVEVVDKTTNIFSRTIDQQEKEIEKLTTRLKKLDTYVDESRGLAAVQAIQEVKVLGSAIGNVAKLQETMIELLRNDISKLPRVSQLRTEIEENLRKDIPRAIRSRDLSLYRTDVSNVEGGRELVQKLRAMGYTAAIYFTGVHRSADQEEEEKLLKSFPPTSSEAHQAIWLGSRVPPKVAVPAILTATKHWPFLRNVHLSEDSPDDPPDYVHSMIYFGGSTNTATMDYRLLAWTDEDFARLDPDMNVPEFHAYVRRFYPQPSTH